MESQTEVVIAAEALRVWVRGQRAAWTEPAVLIPVPPPVQTAPAPAPKISVPAGLAAPAGGGDTRADCTAAGFIAAAGTCAPAVAGFGARRSLYRSIARRLPAR